ncbi:MAG: septum formation initiator family protein [Clostridia bacterium]|nr:septum formation initiator family protein [Clostridia bacterium]MBR2878146.1 septum formation initiator family protein [Clostridia bacterium]MBR2973855.1 septum formation initiator family protein [Clostridia bacterium]MBR3576067.1 septum formation initiator family protein [Clostridia bacterium]
MKILNILSNKFVLIVLSFVFLIYFTVTIIGQSKTIDANKAVLDHYNESLAEQQAIEQEIKEEESLVGTDEYVESIARDTLGLCKTNEKIFVDTKE